MSVDYGEIVCTAVDQIINARLEGLQYNITKLCLIVDDSQRHKGEYIVSDGNARFQAFSTDTSFRNNNNVLVVIPNGDFRMQKTITGRVAATNTEPFRYTSPMDTMVKISGNVFAGIENNAASLLANDVSEGNIIVKVLEVEGKSLTGLTGFTRLGITANFRSWLQGLDVIQGTYGLKVFVFSDNNRYDLTFNNNDMYGNPYQFEDYFYQEKVFDISTINKIDKVVVYFYQNGDFKNGSGQYVAHELSVAEGLESQTLRDNLFVKDVAIYFGYDISAFSGETLLLVSEDKLTYAYKNEGDENIVEPIDLKLQWVHKVNDNEYTLLEQERDIDANSSYEIKWFRYNEGAKEINHYAGMGWESITPKNNDNDISKLLLTDVSLDPERPYEEFKVVGIIKETLEGQVIENTYVSNVLKFVNEKYTNEVLINKSSGYAIEFDDGSQGNYFLYDQNGNILNTGLGQGYKRTARVTYRGGELPLDNEIDYIFWYLPQETSNNPAKTMLIYSIEYLTDNGGKYKNNANGSWLYSMLDYYGTDYIGVERTNGNITQSFSIGNHWNQQKTNNTIRCIISINGIEYELASELKFGRAGTQGTNTTMVLEFVDNENAFIIGKTPQVQCILYNYNGERLNPDTGSYAWSWNNNTYFDIQKTENENIIQIVGKENLTSIPTDNYSILKCVYTPVQDMALTAYLPIAIKDENYSHIEGAKEVIYNHQGLPNYYNDVYKLYEINKDEKPKEVKGCTWGLSKTLGKEDDYPYLKELVRAGKTYQALAVEPFYMQSGNKTCVYVKKDNKVVWSQPILIMQSKYDFAMLNNWDGGLTIDKENGTILSTMLGAGRKNDDNTFSGVLIGDVKGGTGLNSTTNMTGVYGFDDGVMSYALREDGSAIFGAPGKGQIQINGTDGTIKSQNYNQGSGMKIDLDDGNIDIQAKFYFDPIKLTEKTFEADKYYYLDKNNNYILAKEFVNGENYLQKINSSSSVYISPSVNNNDSYFKIKSHEGSPLIDVGRNNYYLQSNDYYIYDKKTGTHFDLADGELIIKKPEVGAVYLSDKEGNLFKVQTKDNQPLIVMRNKEYYLQSALYEGKKQHKINYNNGIYELYNNTRTSLLNGSGTINITSIVALKDNEVYQITEKSNEGEKTFVPGEKIDFLSTTITRTEAKDEDKQNVNVVSITYTPDQYKDYFISQLSPKLINTSKSGLKIDLTEGYISGYDLRLNGINGKNSAQQFILDSSAEKTPFSVGNKFKIDWDGTVYCENLKYLGTKPSDGSTVVNIDDNFYVTSGGGVGGSSANFDKGYFGGGYFGGVAASAKTADYATTAGKANTVAVQSNVGFYGYIATINESGQISQSTKRLGDFVSQSDFDTKIAELEKKISNLEGSIPSTSDFVSSSTYNNHRHQYTDNGSRLTTGGPGNPYD